MLWQRRNKMKVIILFSMMMGLCLQAQSALPPEFGPGCFQSAKKFPVPRHKLSYASVEQRHRAQGISEIEFNSIISKVEEVYRPHYRKAGYDLRIFKDWQDEMVNAGATVEHREAQIYLMGGLARVPAMTADAYAMVLCHEVGHHLGGAPKHPKPEKRWGTVEGEADYFAGLKCMRRYLEGEMTNYQTWAQGLKSKPSWAYCARNFQTESEVALCARSTEAGIRLGEILAKLKLEPKPDINAPDKTVVRQTLTTYPANVQCRLDTYARGAQCTVSLDEARSDIDVKAGACDNRPVCWFASDAFNLAGN